MYMSLYLCAYVCIDVFTRLCIYVCIYVSKHLFICMYIYMILSTHWLATAQPLPWCSELGPYILQNNFSRSKKPHAPCLPPCALIQSVNPYINVRLLLDKSPICIGLCDQRDLAIMSMYGAVGFGYKRVWGSPTLVCVSLGLSCAEPAPLSWATLLLISVSVLEQGHVERGSNVRSCMYVPIYIIYMHTCVCACVCVCVCIRIYIHIYIYKYTYKYIHTHTHTYI